MGPKQPEISIIIPCYTYGRYLPETLKSLLDQTFSDWECVLVANGSDALTLQVIQVFVDKDSRFRKLSTQNHGPSAARNEGIQASRGRYIQLLDADDILENRKFEVQSSYLHAQPETGVVYGEVRYFTDGAPEQWRRSLHLPDREWMPKVSGKGSLLVNTLLRFNIMTIHAPLVRREMMDLVGCMDEALSGFEDWDLWLRMAMSDVQFTFLPVAGSLSLVRTHPGSLNQDRSTMRQYLLRVWEKALESGQLNLKQRVYVWSRMEEEFGEMVLARRTGQAMLSPRSRLVLWAGVPFIYPVVKLGRYLRNLSKS